MFKLQILIEKAFVIFVLALTGAKITSLNEGNSFASSQTISDLIKWIFLIVIQLVTIFLFIRWRTKIISTVIRGNVFLWMLVGIILVSVFWSSAPMVTLSASNNILWLTLFGIYFSARYSLSEQLRFLAWALGISALLSLVIAIALPSYGVMGMGDIQTQQSMAHMGIWQGIYGHKNVLGRCMSLGALVFLLLANSRRRYCWILWVCLCLCVSLILLSTSTTALIVFLTTIALIPIFKALRWNYTFAVPFFLSVILVGASLAILLLDNSESLLGTFGRDTTLTGRTLLWATVIYKIWERPWLGYGYGGFWLGWEGESADIWRVVQWEVPHAHNGFLELWLNLGLLGLTIFVLSFITACVQAVSLVRTTKTVEGLWPLLYLMFLLFANLTESSLTRIGVVWILYVSCCLTKKI